MLIFKKNTDCFYFTRFLTIAITVSFLTACGHKPANTVAKQNQPSSIDQVLSNPESTGEDSEKAVPTNISYEHNEHVQRWIEIFTQKDRERFQRFLNRGAEYREVVEELLTLNEMPKELFYLAMIESGFATHAYSRAKAVGVWQFIPATGKRYGLQVDSLVDERRDPIRATEAAAKYLKDLYNVFGSWHLAMSAYNAGELRVVRAVVRAKSRDFWELVKTNNLPRETANYVPKFLAAMEIGENPKKYGFEVPKAEKYPNLKAVEIPSPVHLKNIALVTGVDFELLRKVNPHLRQSITPSNASTYEIWLPEDSVQKSPQNIVSALQKHRISTRVIATKAPKVKTVVQAPSRHFHIVRKGETLSAIASRYKVTLSYLKRINGLGSNRVQAGSKLRIDAALFRPKSKTSKYSS